MKELQRRRRTMRQLLQTDSEAREIVRNGVLGVIGTGTGTTVSMLAEVEAWLRVTSLVVGIIVGVVTICSIVRKMR